MEYLAHHELAICVRSFEAAALLLAHGYQLLKSPVGQWTYEFDTLDDYLRWAAGDIRVKVHEIITWNVGCGLGEPRLRAYQIMYQSDKAAYDSPQMQWAREFLTQVIRERPRSALWIVIRNGGQPVTIFGKNASLRTQEEMLNLL